MPSSHSGSSHSSFGGGSRSSFGGSRSSFGGSRSSFGGSSFSSSRSYRSGSSSYRSSSSGVSRGPSGHSGSSRGSSYSATRSASAVRGPSGHSGSSHGSTYSPSRPAAGSMYRSRPRARVNQPVRRAGISPLTVFYCLNHDYAYYPESWQAEDGTVYQAGYYDENGKYYQNVKVENAGRDLPMVLTCEYCGTECKVKWEEGTLPNCVNCGAPLSMNNVQSDTCVSNGTQTAQAAQPAQQQTAQTAGRQKRKKRGLLWTVIGVLLLGSCVNSLSTSGTPSYSSNNYGSSYSSYEASPYDGTGNMNTLPVVDSSAQSTQTGEETAPVCGQPLLLTESKDGGYTRRGIYKVTKNTYSKRLVWDEEADSWYDAETGFWLWYETNVDIPVWQYWIEGVSDRYGDYGWMECEGDTWYVQNEAGDWEIYKGDTTSFWHIQNRFD